MKVSRTVDDNGVHNVSLEISDHSLQQSLEAILVGVDTVGKFPIGTMSNGLVDISISDEYKDYKALRYYREIYNRENLRDFLLPYGVGYDSVDLIMKIFEAVGENVCPTLYRLANGVIIAHGLNSLSFTRV